MVNTNAAVMTAKRKATSEEIQVSYGITMCLLLGAYLLYAVFTFPPDEFSPTHVCGFVLSLFFVLPFFPFLVIAYAAFTAFNFWASSNYLLAFASLCAAAAFFFLWWGIWYGLYGKSKGASQKFFRP